MRDHVPRLFLRQNFSSERFKTRREIGLRFGKSVFKFAVMLMVVSVVASVSAVLVFSVVPVPLTPLVVLRWIDAKVDGREARVEKKWVPIEKIPESALRAAIASEDFRFVEHSGFDFDAIQKAIKFNQKYSESSRRRGRHRMRGASTISQQTAKNVFLWPSRSWLRKGVEAWFTVLIESVWSKRRILEVYLNVIEFGDGIYGVEAASRHFFNKSASRLTRSEAALLIAVLPNPRKLMVHRPSAYVRFRQTAILRRFSYVDLPSRSP